MRLSKFAIFLPKYPEKEDCLAFSTLTRAIVQLPMWLYTSLANGTDTVEDNSAIEPLKNTGIVVDDNVDEDLLYRFWSNRTRYRDSQTAITCIMTYGCNCACSYCYEESVRQGPEGEHFTLGLVNELIRWIKRYITLRRSHALNLCFHGGEPLLRTKEIELIASSLRKFCDKKGVTRYFSLVTNGTLLTPQIADRLVNVGIQHMMITLDGPKPVHDERRHFIGGRGTFDIIVKNILYTVDRFKVYITINIDKHNCESASELATFLANKRLQKKLGKINIAWVAPTKTALEHHRDHDIPVNERVKYYVGINRTFLEKGFSMGSMLNLGFCTMITDNQFIIDPRGNIYKCVTGVGDENFRIGHIKDDPNLLAIKTSQFIEKDLCANEKCMSCVYRPMCRGGCRHESYVRYGDMTKGFCLREYFEAVIPEIVKVTAEQAYTEVSKNS